MSAGSYIGNAADRNHHFAQTGCLERLDRGELRNIPDTGRGMVAGSIEDWMKDSRAFNGILIVLAATLVVFGGWRLLDPSGFYAFSGLALGDDAGLLSEVRAAGGIIMVSGLVVGLGAFRHAWSRISVVVAAVVFLSLGLGRLLGVALDGSPGPEVLQGMGIELVLGGLALVAFFKYGTGTLQTRFERTQRRFARRSE